MEVDIRSNGSKIDVIRFADKYFDHGKGQADKMESIFDEVRIYETANGDYVRISSLEHAQNLITAINLAIEKEWLA